jgi:hypothetical protein
MSIFSVIARQFAVPLRNSLSDTCILWQVKPKAALLGRPQLLAKAVAGGDGRERSQLAQTA